MMEAANCSQWPSQWPPGGFKWFKGMLFSIFSCHFANEILSLGTWTSSSGPLRVVFSHAIALGSIQYTHCWYFDTILDPTRLSDCIPIPMNWNLSLTAIYSQQYTYSFDQGSSLDCWANPHGHKILNIPISIPHMLDNIRSFSLAKKHQFSRWIPHFCLLKTHDFSWSDPSGTQLLFIVCSTVASKDQFKLFTINYHDFGILFFLFFIKTTFFFGLLQTCWYFKFHHLWDISRPKLCLLMSVNRPSRGRMRADLIVAQRYNLAVGCNRPLKTYL